MKFSVLVLRKEKTLPHWSEIEQHRGGEEINERIRIFINFALRQTLSAKFISFHVSLHEGVRV
jgi:hypothetical protein